MPPELPESNSFTPPRQDASHALLNEVQTPQHKSYLQTGVDWVVDSTLGKDSGFGKEVSRYAPGLLQTAAMFTPGRAAMATSIGLGALNEMKVGDSLQMQMTELGMGGLKGGATKALFNKVGNANIMEGSLMSVPAKGMVLGLSTRALDIGLTPQTWLNKNGGVDIGDGLGRTLSGTVDRNSLMMDAAIFSVAHGGTFGLNRALGGAIDRSQALRNITMGGTFGLTSGATSEYMHQRDAGGPISWGEIAKRGFIQAGLDAAASAPGALYGDANFRNRFNNTENSNNVGPKTIVTALSIGALEMAGGPHTHIKNTAYENNIANGGVAPSERVIELPNNTSTLLGDGGRNPRVSTSFDGGRMVYDAATNSAVFVMEPLRPILVEKTNNANVQLDAQNSRYQVVDSSGKISGNGTVEVSGDSTHKLVLSPKEGETLRVIVKDGTPSFEIPDGTLGKIEFVNRTTTNLPEHLLKDASGNFRNNVDVLDPLTGVFSPAEIQRIEAVRDAQRQLPKGTLFDDSRIKVESLPPSERPAAQARVDAAEAKLRDLTDRAYGNCAEKQERILHIVVGPPGAGKSSLLVDPLAKANGALVVDSDHIKPMIEGYEKGLGTNAIHADSAEVGKRVLERAFANGDNIVYPQLGRVEGAMRELIDRARNEGYKVALHIADLPPEDAARRVFNRSEEAPHPETGIRQMVDPRFALVDAGRNPLKVFEQMVAEDKVDWYQHYDTNVPRGQDAVLVKASPRPIWMPSITGE